MAPVSSDAREVTNSSPTGPICALPLSVRRSYPEFGWQQATRHTGTLKQIIHLGGWKRGSQRGSRIKKKQEAQDTFNAKGIRAAMFESAARLSNFRKSCQGAHVGLLTKLVQHLSRTALCGSFLSVSSSQDTKNMQTCMPKTTRIKTFTYMRILFVRAHRHGLM